MAVSGARVVAFCVHPDGFRIISQWIERCGHDLALVVTLPGADHYGPGQGSILDVASRSDVVVSRRLRSGTASLVAAVRPDLVVSASFARLIPDEIIRIPRYGALNLHPAPLPRGRGPNPQRLTYEGDPEVGATLHRMAEEFDAGAILSRQVRPLGTAELTPQGLFAVWTDVLGRALDEGSARALAGEPGEEQDESWATYAAPFTDDEYRLRWDEPALTIQRRVAALNLLGPRARAVLGDAEPVAVAVRRLDGEHPAAAPGTVLDRTGDVAVVRVADGAVEVTLAAERSGS